MTHDSDRTDPLAAHFAALKATPARPDAALMARILADADREQPGRRAAPAAPAALAARLSAGARLAAIMRALGGWPAMAGLAAATLAGVWIGVSPPEGLAEAARLVLSEAGDGVLVDLDPNAAFILPEGAS